MKSAIVQRFTNQDVLRSLATTCKTLESLEFLSGSIAGDSLCEIAMCATQLKKLTLTSNISLSLDAVTQIVRHRPSLTHAEFHSIVTTGVRADWRVDLPNLQKLTLGCGQESSSPFSALLSLVSFHHPIPTLHPYSPTIQPALFARAPNLLDLSLSHWRLHPNLLEEHDFTPLTSLTSLTLTRFALSTFPRLPSSLTTLHLSSDNATIFTPLAPLAARNDQNALDSHLPHLLSLSLTHIAGLGPTLLSNLLLHHGTTDSAVDLSAATKLHTLSLAHAGILEKADLFALLHNPRLSALRALDLTAAPVDDEFVDTLALTQPALASLDLSKTRITGVAVKELLKRLGRQLKWLGLDQCTGISSDDVVELARRMGVEVRRRMMEPKGGKGRAVGRYFG